MRGEVCYWAVCPHRTMLLASRVCSGPLWSLLPNRAAPRRLIDRQSQKEAKRKHGPHAPLHTHGNRGPAVERRLPKKQNQTTHSQIHGAALSGGPLGDVPVTGPSRDLRFILCRWTHCLSMLTVSFTSSLKIHRHRKVCEDG